jgi:hypothetical protein
MASDLALLSVSLANPGKKFPITVSKVAVSIVDGKMNKQKSADQGSDSNAIISDDCFRISSGEMELPIILDVMENHSLLFNLALIQDYLPTDFFSPDAHNYQILVHLEYQICDVSSDSDNDDDDELEIVHLQSSFEAGLNVWDLFIQKHENDVSISFTPITPNIQVRQIFTVQVFLVNSSDRTFDFVLYIPMKE